MCIGYRELHTRLRLKDNVFHCHFSVCFYVPFPDLSIVFVFFQGFLAQSGKKTTCMKGTFSEYQNLIFKKELDSEDI